MYDRAIREGTKDGYVTSSSAPTYDAERVWLSKKLRKKYDIKRKGYRYEVQ